jgi:hypothetical protein
MAKKIYKYPLPMENVSTITMPKGAEVLTVQVQHGSPYVWAIVDDKASPERRNFEMFGTGFEMPETHFIESRKYIGTIQLQRGDLVYHVFLLIVDI